MGTLVTPFGKILLVLFTGWLLFTASSLTSLVLPAHRRYADAMIVSGVPVSESPLRVFTLAFKVIQTALSGISAAVDAFFKTEHVLAKAAKFAWDIARRTLLNMLVNDIIAWVQGGGKPRFITDFRGALENLGDQALGNFANTLVGTNLCGDFRRTIQLVIPTTQRLFEERAACTASQIATNMERIWETQFGEGGGGWGNWLKLNEAPNNVIGAFFIAQGELAERARQLAKAHELKTISEQGWEGQKECAEWAEMTIGQDGNLTATGANLKKDITGNVTLGQERCTEEFVEPDVAPEDIGFAPTSQERGAASSKYRKITCPSRPNQPFTEGAFLKCTREQTITPGQVVGRLAADAVGVDIPWLINAKEITEYLGAIVNAIVNRVAREGLAAVRRESGSFTRASAQPPVPFECSRLSEASLQEGCERSVASISPLAQDPIQIVTAERPLMPQLAIDLKNFQDELGEFETKLTALRDVQRAIKAKEEVVINAAATIVVAPTTPRDPVEGRDAAQFPLPIQPPQSAACTLGSFASARRDPDRALQFDDADADDLKNTMQQTFAPVTLQGLTPTLSGDSLDRLSPIGSIGSLEVDQVMRYSTDTGPCPTDPALTATKDIWTSDPPAPRNTAVEIADDLADTEAKLADIDHKQTLVAGLIATSTDYRAVLDKWNVRLGIQSGAVTTDRAVLDQALAELTPLRNQLIAGFQDLMDSFEPELTNLLIEFIDFRTELLKESSDIDLVVGSRDFPAGGGYYGELAELEVVAQALSQNANSCQLRIESRPTC